MKVEVEKNLLAKNEQRAQENKSILEQADVFAFDIVGSPGCGKTTLLEYLLSELGQEINLAVIEGDLYTRRDAERLEGYGSQVIQINTQGACHLEALSIQQVLKKLDL
ncbi:hydrogenase accessory protein HypB [Halanaerobacter jeridensis]|uniref:Hydrogenase accessory protein HypB n=1 Tax=Halanaerobacter jeridensis TaxID=706427 RepID=A0A939BP58_9FIRM|nr:hydrogenase accessory protein HypB [Halanaerobacter jeridensis]